MTARSPKDLARDPLTALTAMAGAALLALGPAAPDGADPTPGPASPTASGGLADLPPVPAPAVGMAPIPSLEGLTLDVDGCAVGRRTDPGSPRVSARFLFVVRGA